MSASLHALLADELDIPDQKAEKLLVAMLREVRKRAQRGGVRLPDLGKFKVEDGDLTFSPADSLARAVNHRFEGLESEHLRGAAEPDAEKDEDSEGPSTITLGYQDSSGWTPLDADESQEETENKDANTGDETEADTEEFELPDSDPPPSEQGRATSPSSEAEEPSAPDDAADAGPPDRDSTAEADDESESTEETEDPAPASDTEELYPLVDEVTGPSAPTDPPSSPADSPTADAESPESASQAPTDDEERDELSKIWESGPDEDTPEFSADAEVDEGDSSSQPPPEPDAPAADPDPAPPSDADLEAEAEATSSSESPPAPSTSSAEGGSALPRVLVTLLVLVLLGGGAWYILGQRGMVPPPGQALSQLTGSPAPNQTTSSEEQRAAGPSGASATGTSEQDASSSSEAREGASTASAAPTGGGAATGIEPAAGGWTIVVASRADRAAATSLVDTYQQRFQNPEQPVDVVQGTVDNTTRYRVGVGQFSSRGAADAFLKDNSAALPDGAWTLALE
jgi:hypothetical protein